MTVATFNLSDPMLLKNAKSLDLKEKFRLFVNKDGNYTVRFKPIGEGHDLTVDISKNGQSIPNTDLEGASGYHGTYSRTIDVGSSGDEILYLKHIDNCLSIVNKEFNNDQFNDDVKTEVAIANPSTNKSFEVVVREYNGKVENSIFQSVLLPHNNQKNQNIEVFIHPMILV